MSKFIENLYSTDHISKSKIKKLLYVLLILYIFIFIIVDYYELYFGKINKLCLATCDTSSCTRLTKFSRGSEYYLTNNSNPYDCIFTIWECSHIIFHIFIGYHFNLLYSIAIGSTFELYEKYFHNCENYLDIMYNTIGGLIGVGLRTL